MNLTFIVSTIAPFAKNSAQVSSHNYQFPLKSLGRFGKSNHIISLTIDAMS